MAIYIWGAESDKMPVTHVVLSILYWTSNIISDISDIISDTSDIISNVLILCQNGPSTMVVAI